MTGFDPANWDAVVFDVDGTLYDQRPVKRRMLGELAMHCLRHPLDLGLLRRLQTFRRCREALSDSEQSGAGRLQYEIPARALGVSPESLQAEVEEWMERRPLVYLAQCRVAGAGRFFERLRRRGVKIGVLSDYPARRKLVALDLRASVVVSGVDPEVDRLKPDPAGLKRAQELLGVPVGRCLMIGDRDDRDGECARRLGMPYLLRGRDFADYVELSRRNQPSRSAR